MKVRIMVGQRCGSACRYSCIFPADDDDDDVSC